ncbi:MarR family winged helix-turn-helix transcriptional regulator [Arenibaculum pallidiluteum]|uniref:MarR family winged helix-turn-helix transcriptional regulator n=1 Tax=Arenibaculum pallidiluteum TaxID=2812559 RepID=UPI001A9740D3|nr:MarR family winged helix-turn-helix transcriptional regulator [Arenibaculum pallidiluteum]
MNATGKPPGPGRRPLAAPADEAGRSPEPRGPDDQAVDMGGLATTVGYVMRQAQTRVLEDFSRSLEALGLRPAQFSVLLVIDRNPGLKQSQVSAVLGIQRTNFVAMVDELERLGLALREPVPNDRRSYALVLTDAGRHALAEALRLQALHERRIEEALGASGRETLLRLLGIILSMRSDGAAPHPGAGTAVSSGRPDASR